jgi:large subunit ribosomal protein L36
MRSRNACVAVTVDASTRRFDMKVRNSLHSLKSQPGSQVVRRRGRTFVINKRDPRVKARQG